MPPNDNFWKEIAKMQIGTNQLNAIVNIVE